LRIRANIRRKSRKSNKVCRENNKGSDKSKSSIEKNTREMKRQVYKERKEAKVWKKDNRIILSTKDCVQRMTS